MEIEEIKRYILNYIEINGPSLPSTIAQKIRKELLITNAILSQMVENGLLKISNLKIGSSPLYFLPNQEAQLERFLNYLKDKEKEAVQLLKKEKVLKHETLDPVIRIALSNAKDFAKPIKIKEDNYEKIFWRYYLVSNEEAESLIKSIIESERMKADSKGKEVGLVEEVKKVEAEIKEGKVKEEKKLEEWIKIETREKEKGEKEKKKKEKEKSDVKGVIKEEKINFEEWINRNFSFVEKISQSIFKGSKEILGELLEFLIIVKDKKRISDSDLIIALREGQERKMPVIFLTSGHLTKKADEVVKSSGSFLIIKNINSQFNE
ncbi:MAG: hypothetical protein QW244_00780 [Candidatus Pacearchaeota archaeon]